MMTTTTMTGIELEIDISLYNAMLRYSSASCAPFNICGRMKAIHGHSSLRYNELVSLRVHGTYTTREVW